MQFQPRNGQLRASVTNPLTSNRQNRLGNLEEKPQVPVQQQYGAPENDKRDQVEEISEEEEKVSFNEEKTDKNQ